MKNRFLTILLVLAYLVYPNISKGEKYHGATGAKSGSVNPKSISADCLPAQTYTFLKVNNVNARINTGGDMFWDVKDIAQYEIPRDSKKHSLFASALWLGGIDINGQLKVAAQRYRNDGVDFWTGPLTVDGTAAIDAETCNEYDKHFPISRAEVEAHIAWFENQEEFKDYVIPNSIRNWPAHGDVTKNQSYYLAPFYDYDGNGTYDPESGDYPYYDFDNVLCKSNQTTAEGNGILADQVVKGDETLWWVFNDKGGIHGETQSAPIGFEIRAQAFGFTTNDEINNMTFMSYEIINRSTYTLTGTYFSQWIDPDLGYSHDDYVGCDVERGLGYCYNGNDFDGTGQVNSYGAQPPAVGVDFFQGPYMDPDGIDNPMYYDVYDNEGNVIGRRVVVGPNINGVNFGDSIVDNERYGMRRFVYHNNTGSGVPPYMTDPDKAVDYYNFLRGIWKDGTKMLYGGNGHATSGAWGGEADFMFPGDTDSLNWGTNGVKPNPKMWSEREAGNPPNDRRFMHSAGPFTLRPGNVNYITVGIPWARATSGGAYASVELLRRTDDKAQSLFDNCFKILDGPDAPDLVIQELDRELVLFLDNRSSSNNYKEQYKELDYSILERGIRTYDPVLITDTLGNTTLVQKPNDTLIFDRYYRFQGYKVYQVKDESVSVSELDDADKARLIYQGDIKDEVGDLINYVKDESIGLNVPKLMVDANNTGISHSIRVTEDAFATTDKALVNHKKYYFIAVAYAYNNYLTYDPEGDDLDRGGQKIPYKAGRKAALGSIKSVSAIPQRPIPGTTINSSYGDIPEIIRLEGNGNGGMNLDLSKETIDEIMSGEPFSAEQLKYNKNGGPIDVRIIDPLNIQPGNYILKFDTVDTQGSLTNWELYSEALNKSWTSDLAINVRNEQIIPEIGLGISINQTFPPGDSASVNNGFISATINYADSSKVWFNGVQDNDSWATINGDFNWIRSGTVKDEDYPANGDYPGVDDNQVYEKLLGGTWAPYRLVSNKNRKVDGVELPGNVPGNPIGSVDIANNRFSRIPSVDIVLTPDKSKWTRCPVIETGRDAALTQGNREFWKLRGSPSIDKDGNFADPNAAPSNDPNSPNYIQSKSMGWFPGYVINVETGQRMNVFYGEDSWLGSDFGRDMKWNPSSRQLGSDISDSKLGGKHFLYVMMSSGTGKGSQHVFCPPYDAGAWLYAKLDTASNSCYRNITFDIAWVTIPLAIDGKEWLSNEATIKLRVSKPYMSNLAYGFPVNNPSNDNYPLYSFNLDKYSVTKDNIDVAKDKLDDIKVVPNPYLGFSDYESSNLDNRVKIINLPEKCVISIYSMNGTLIRQLTKDEPYTAIEWDLKNSASIPIASGVYLIHVKAEGIGETVLKWFATIRPTDLNTF